MSMASITDSANQAKLIVVGIVPPRRIMPSSPTFIRPTLLFLPLLPLHFPPTHVDIISATLRMAVKLHHVITGDPTPSVGGRLHQINRPGFLSTTVMDSLKCVGQ